MRKRVSILLIMSGLVIASSYAMHNHNPELSPSLQIFREIGEIRVNMALLITHYKAIMDPLHQSIESHIQRIAKLLEDENIEDAQKELPTLKECYKKFEQAIQCIINSQKTSSISHIKSKL